MSAAPPLPPKQDVANEIGRLASTLTNDMQAAAAKKAQELGFDLTRGRLTVEETLIKLADARDVLADAAATKKLDQLPLKLQYLLYTQTQKVADTLALLVNGTDAVQMLEDVVDDITSSIWQYNLHNLSGEVLGFQQKMNQLKTQETLIRKARRGIRIQEQHLPRPLPRACRKTRPKRQTRGTRQVHSVHHRVRQQGNHVPNGNGVRPQQRFNTSRRYHQSRRRPDKGHHQLVKR